MRRRSRAVLFAALALAAAALGAIAVSGYGSRVAVGYGPLREVVVVTGPLASGKTIGPRQAQRDLEVRRVPTRFVPVGALADPGDALGLQLRGPAPAGSYLLAAQLRAPRRPRGNGLGRGRRPVEIAVSGADALLATGSPGRGSKVDVVITAEPDGPGPGRTYVGAEAVPLLALGPGEDGASAGGIAAATLGLTREQALRLIAAESYARKLTLLPTR